MSDSSVRPRFATLLVAAGGVCGATARYGIDLAATAPFGTLLANVVGSVLLGAATAEVPWLENLSERRRLLVATGFLSSLTTYSTFAVEAATAAPVVAVAYVAVTYGLGFAGVLVGRRLASGRARSPAPEVDR